MVKSECIKGEDNGITWGNEKYVQNLDWKPMRHRWKNNIKMCHSEIGCEDYGLECGLG
jgi:hypothetical protein